MSRFVLLRTAAAVALSIALPFTAFAEDAPTAPRLLHDFETAADVDALKLDATQVSLIASPADAERHALRITFGRAEWPNVAMRSGDDTPWDWSGHGNFLLDVTNPGDTPLRFGVRVDDAVRSMGTRNARTGWGNIQPGETRTFAMPFAGGPMDFGMRGLPSPDGAVDLGAGGAGPFDLGHIYAWQVFMHRPTPGDTLIIDNVRLTPPPQRDLEGIVDRFGQYAKADWPGKLDRIEQLAARREAEQAELAAHPELPGRDRFGGWADGPRVDATGYFRTQQIDGKWWLVTPEGRLFFSAGITTLYDESRTITTGREYMFQWLPEDSDPLARHRSHTTAVHAGPVKRGSTYDFYRANLQRKYGENYKPAWRDTTLARLRSWGFNTGGGWTQPEFFNNGRLPYVATVERYDGQHARISSGVDQWRKASDPWDPQFAVDIAERIERVASQVKNDPWCIGYFVGNEESWGDGKGQPRDHYGIAYGTLATHAADASAHAKRAFIAQLREKYDAIAALNEAWATQFDSWDALDAPYHAPAAPIAAMRADLSDFIRSHATQYFTVVRDELKRAAPNHLYLGCRFSSRTPEAVEAAAELVDVVSFNYYGSALDPHDWAFTLALNKPCIIGEFQFGALDRGMFHTGLMAATDQQDRAAKYQRYVRSVLDHPAFVGAHWFQYLDEPLTGRFFDGENYAIGFVSVTDTPYREMVEAARELHAQMYDRRDEANDE